MILVIIILVVMFGWSAPAEPDCAVSASETEGCGAPEPGIDAWMPVDLGGIRGVIVAEADGPLFIAGDDYWAPSLAEITGAEDAIQHEQGGLEHIRQYVGFVEDGERKIYINGFCDPLQYDWEHEPVLVDDGGDCYFASVYNVDDEALEWFTFNGNA